MPDPVRSSPAALASAFAVRLRDLLCALESSALVSASETRLRGLGEQLRFACMALPCDEALVALELSTLGRLEVPGVASADEWRAQRHDFLPSGTPFAYLLGGGSGYLAEVAEGDAMLDAVRPVLGSAPRQAIFVPLRVGASIIGGAALFSTDGSMGDAQLGMAEQLAEVLALTLESFRTERVLIELFARALPDLVAEGAPTAFADGLARYLHELRLAPAYRRRLELAERAGRVAAKGAAEARLALEILGRVEDYLEQLGRGEDGEGE